MRLLLSVVIGFSFVLRSNYLIWYWSSRNDELKEAQCVLRISNRKNQETHDIYNIDALLKTSHIHDLIVISV